MAYEWGGIFGGVAEGLPVGFQMAQLFKESKRKQKELEEQTKSAKELNKHIEGVLTGLGFPSSEDSGYGSAPMPSMTPPSPSMGFGAFKGIPPITDPRLAAQNMPSPNPMTPTTPAMPTTPTMPNQAPTPTLQSPALRRMEEGSGIGSGTGLRVPPHIAAQTIRKNMTPEQDAAMKAYLMSALRLPNTAEGNKERMDVLGKFAMAKQEKPSYEKLGEGDTLVDPTTGRVVASGLPKQKSEDVFSKINPSDYTDESIRAFQVALAEGRQDYSLLQPRQNAFGSGSGVETEGKLRSEFLKLSAPFIDIRDSFGRMRSAADNPSAAGDVALIFNYMKILDPQSVVRESEYATAQNAASIPERVRAFYNRAMNGEKLSDATRADFMGKGKSLFERQLTYQNKLVNGYKKLAGEYKLDHKRIIIDLGDPDVTETIRYDSKGNRI